VVNLEGEELLFISVKGCLENLLAIGGGWSQNLLVLAMIFNIGGQIFSNVINLFYRVLCRLNFCIL
jgi:hypothetical protein